MPGLIPSRYGQRITSAIRLGVSSRGGKHVRKFHSVVWKPKKLRPALGLGDRCALGRNRLQRTGIHCMHNRYYRKSNTVLELRMAAI